jgi:hypothetical protein
MKRLIVRFVVAGAFVSGVAGVGVANPEFAADVGLDFWNLPELNGEIDKCRKQNDELEQQTRNTMARMAAKLRVVDETHDGILTLREAALRFRNLNAGNPMFTEQARLNRPNCSDDECQYWNVIDCARNTIGRYPDLDQFVSRITEELQSLKERGDSPLRD